MISAANPPTAADAAANVVLAVGGSIATLGDTGIPPFDGDWNCAGDWKVVSATKGALKLSGTLTRKGPLVGGFPTALLPRS